MSALVLRWNSAQSRRKIGIPQATLIPFGGSHGFLAECGKSPASGTTTHSANNPPLHCGKPEVPCRKRPENVQKRARLQLLGAGHIPGDDLLSQDLSSHYHRRCSVSLPGSEWDRVVPPRSGHQRSTLYDQGWDSGEHIGRNMIRRMLSISRNLSTVPGAVEPLRCCPLSGIHMEIVTFFTIRIMRASMSLTQYLDIRIQK